MKKVMLMAALLVTPLFVACEDVTSTVTDQVNGARDAATDTLSGALAPVRQAADEISRRANAVGEGISEVRNGVKKVSGAFSGSGTTW